MKKALTVLMVVMVISMPALAATTQTVTVSASVDSILDLAIAVYKLDGLGDPTGADLGTNMDFGQLVRDTGNGVMYGADAFAVFLGTNASSRSYAVNATMTSMTSGANTLPPAMACTIVSAKSDGLDIDGDTLNTSAQNAIMSNSTIYTSNSSGTSAVIQLVYGISGGPEPFSGWEPILLAQPAGSYTSSLVYTIALT